MYVQRGNFHVDNQLYSLSPHGDPETAASDRSRSRSRERSTRVSIDGVEHVISPVSTDEIRLYDSATLNSRSSGTSIDRPTLTAVIRLHIWYCDTLPVSFDPWDATLRR